MDKDENKENKEIIIKDPSQRITPNILNRFEITKVLSTLAKEIADGRAFDQDILEEIDEVTAQNIAEKELEWGITNLKIYRQIGDNTYEEWYVDEMEYYVS